MNQPECDSGLPFFTALPVYPAHRNARPRPFRPLSLPGLHPEICKINDPATSSRYYEPGNTIDRVQAFCVCSMRNQETWCRVRGIRRDTQFLLFVSGGGGS